MNSEKHKSLYKAQNPFWKDTYRKRCQDRLKKSRDKFLMKFRQTGCQNNEEGVDQIMAEEWDAMNCEHNTEHTTGIMPNSTEADLKVFEEIRIELIQEEQQILAEYESSLQCETRASEAALTDTFVCPVCQLNPLMKNKSVIFCYCGVRIDTETDCMNLDMVKENFTKGLRQHNDKCSGQPKFSYSDFGGIGMYNILMTCDDCHEMFIVV